MPKKLPSGGDMDDDHEPTPRTTELRLSSWEEFLERVAGFEDPNRKPWDEVWFRGQSKAAWLLDTTLERRWKKTPAVADYLKLVAEVGAAVETFTGSQFPMPQRQDVEQFCREYDLFGQNLRGLATYLAHLRHGGFPSPLLDWSVSPYVAAYFAFRHARHDGDVAIYAYREWSGGFKIGSSDGPQIMSLGPLFKTHKRHFRQQSRYTACVQFDDGKWHFQAHDAVFRESDHSKQDSLWKMTIPASERLKVMRFCDLVNLNEFTLFDTEEGLLETQAMRVFDLRP
jgi:hypothetical protein